MGKQIRRGLRQTGGLSAWTIFVERSKVTMPRRTRKATPNFAEGYGGKFGVMSDRMDKAAVGHDYKHDRDVHASVVDSKKGFGGKFGVQTDRMDKSAVGTDYQQKKEHHASVMGGKTGFGGKFGVQSDRMDKSAVGHDYKHESDAHCSQVDAKKGFGGKFGVQTDRVDKSACSFSDMSRAEDRAQRTTAVGAATGGIRAKFESLATEEKPAASTAKPQRGSGGAECRNSQQV